MGDEFLRRIGGLLASTFEGFYNREMAHTKDRPIIARPSGDEFAVFLPHSTEKQCLAVAEEIRASIASFRFTEISLSLTASMGIALYPVHGANSRVLLTKADTAMYRAKELGRNKVYTFREEDKELEKMQSRLSWRDKILTALEEERFEPWFQPILDITTGTVSHYEALARLRDIDGKIVLPGAFIEVAERFGIVGSIDKMIIEKTMRVQADERKRGRRLCFSMNLSAKDLVDEGFLNFLKTRISRTGADPDALVFEITETAAISDLARAVKFIKALRTIGCHFSLDDFGVGFTSFIYLREMNVDYIKIDGTFIRKLKDSPTDQIFVKSMSEVAKGLGIKSVAEFVEDMETVGLLKGFSVDYAQGYCIGKPAPKPEAIGPIKT
jgi:diguanylate cyclase (GGDEF)-like protein